MPSHRLLAPFAVAALALSLAACSPDDADPPPTAAPTSAVSESATPSAETSSSEIGSKSPAAVPAPDAADYPAMGEQTDEGAMQFVQYFWAVFTWSHEVGSIKSVSALYDETCTTCAENAVNIQTAAAAGNLITDTQITDLAVSTEENPDYDKVVQYSFRLESTPASDDTSGEPDSYDYYTAIMLRWTGEGWIVVGANVEVEETEVGAS